MMAVSTRSRRVSDEFAVVKSRYPRIVGSAGNSVAGALRSLAEFGLIAKFIVDGFRYIGLAVSKYRKENIRLIAEIGMGTGALAVIGGTVVIVAFMTFSAGALLAIQGFASLGNIGVEALTGFLAAFINVRVAAPVTAGIALSATIGGGATAQLGAMRISEEIDALEVMAIQSVAYLVSTRLVAGMLGIIPIYSMAVLMSFLASRTYTVDIAGQSSGVYDHYFSTFLRPTDLFWSFLQAMLMAMIVMLVHCYYGYNASGGPAGVGAAVGKAVRASLISVVLVTLLASLAIYGTSGNFDLAG